MNRLLYNELNEKLTRLEKAVNGGAGSGNWGHAGRPGEVGGSSPSGVSASKSKTIEKRTYDHLRNNYLELGFDPNTVDTDFADDKAMTIYSSLESSDILKLVEDKVKADDIYYDFESGIHKYYKEGRDNPANLASYMQRVNHETNEAVNTIIAYERNIARASQYPENAAEDFLSSSRELRDYDSSTARESLDKAEARIEQHENDSEGFSKFAKVARKRIDTLRQVIDDYDKLSEKVFDSPRSDKIIQDPSKKANSVIEKTFNGGKGSGNFGHSGRPGEVGGSGSGKAVVGVEAYKAIADSHKKAKAEDEKIRTQDRKALYDDAHNLVETSWDAAQRSDELLEISSALVNVSANLDRARKAEKRLKTASEDDKWMDRARTLRNLDEANKAMKTCDKLIKDKEMGDKVRTLAESAKKELKWAYDELQKSWEKLDKDAQKKSKNNLCNEICQKINGIETIINGGKGSGNFGHAGRLGERGGSAPSGYGATKQDRRLKKTVSREDVKKSVEEARSKYYLGKSRYEKIDKDGILVMQEPLNDKDYKQALEDYASKVKELRDIDSKSDDMRVKQGLAKIARIEEKIGKTALVTTDDLSGIEGYISSFIDKDGKEYWYEKYTEEVRDYGNDHKEYVAPAVEKARKDGHWDSYEITGSQIKKKLKDYGINTEGLSVSKSRAGYSDAWHISGSGIKTDLPSVERIVKEKLEHIDRDERSYEILAGGNTYVFVRDEDRNSFGVSPAVFTALKNKIDQLEKMINGGKGSGNFGHSGRPGEVGGSAPSGSGLSAPSGDRTREDDLSHIEKYEGKTVADTFRKDPRSEYVDEYQAIEDAKEYLVAQSDEIEGTGEQIKLTIEAEARKKLGLPSWEEEADGDYSMSYGDLVELSGTTKDLIRQRSLGDLEKLLGKDAIDEALDYALKKGGQDFAKRQADMGQAGFSYDDAKSDLKKFADKFNLRDRYGAKEGIEERSKSFREAWEDFARDLGDDLDDGFIAIPIRRNSNENDEVEMDKAQYSLLMNKIETLTNLVKNGGKGSGNFGHSGRPGEVGGSAPEGQSGGSSNEKSRTEQMKLAGFMQLAKDTPLEFKQTSFHGGEPRNPDWRDVTKIQSKSLKLGDSWLDLPKASLVEIEWDGKNGKIKCYEAGFRDYNDKEKKALAEWESISSTEDYRQRAERDVLTDGSSTYYQEKAFWEDKGMPYMFHTYSQGKYRKQNPSKKDKDGHYVYEIQDDSIKGKLWGEYEFRKKENSLELNDGKGPGNFADLR